MCPLGYTGAGSLIVVDADFSSVVFYNTLFDFFFSGVPEFLLLDYLDFLDDLYFLLDFDFFNEAFLPDFDFLDEFPFLADLDFLDDLPFLADFDFLEDLDFLADFDFLDDLAFLADFDFLDADFLEDLDFLADFDFFEDLLEILCFLPDFLAFLALHFLPSLVVP